MNYNILHGFHETSPPFSLEQGRLDAAKALVANIDPDILVLTEACYAIPTPYGQTMNYRKLFGYQYGLAVPWGKHEWANCVLSKFPLRGERIDLPHRTALRAHIDLGLARPLTMDVLHLPPDIAETEKLATLARLEMRPSQYILAGDLNSLSPDDHYDAHHLLNDFRPLLGEKRAEGAVRSLMERDCVGFVLGTGLRDTYRARNQHFQRTVPTSLAARITDSGMRVDYIFASPDIFVCDANIITGPLAEQASDHYPIYARLRLADLGESCPQ